MRHVAILLTALTLCSPACAFRDHSPPESAAASPLQATPPLDAHAQAAAAISTRLDAYQQVEGRLEDAGGDARFVAYYDDDQLRYVAERLDLEPGNSTIGEYYFDHGRLFYYAANKRARSADETTLEAITTRIGFDSDGALVSAERTVNGESAPVADDEILAVRVHVQFLAIAARVARAGLRQGGNERLQVYSTLKAE